MMPLFLASAISDWLAASVHSGLPGGILVLADAAVRALLVACIVGAALGVLAARHVPAQKTAWGLVLAGALLMPVLAPWAGNASWLPSSATLVVPAHAWSQYVRAWAASLLPARATTEATHATVAQTSAPVAESTVAASAAVERMDVSAPAISPADRFPAPTISNGQRATLDVPASRSMRTTYYLPLSDLVWMIYGAVCLVLLLRLAYGLGGAIGLWQSAEPIRLNSHLADGLNLRSSTKISSPVTVGSAVVLPAEYEEWDAEKLRIVLAHERSHVRQGDFYMQALAGLYTAIFWFSPLGWWLKRKLSDLSETISDHAGLEEADSHASYARILLEFAALPRRTEVGVAMARTGRISQRIERLLNENSFRQAFAGGRGRLWAALVLVPAVLFAAAALIRVQAAQTLQHPAAAKGLRRQRFRRLPLRPWQCPFRPSHPGLLPCRLRLRMKIRIRTRASLPLRLPGAMRATPIPIGPNLSRASSLSMGTGMSTPLMAILMRS
jgi:beta-lactamase regulating signal transducer with metallopeptidase domain